MIKTVVNAMITNKLLGIFLILHCFAFFSANGQCLDENNNPVDWFVIYKLPKLKQDDELITKGTAYAYMTSDEYDNWIYSSLSIDSEESILGNTLKELYKTPEKHFYVLYNDETPAGKVSSTKGHTKGVVVANKNGGYWLVHSTPKFPDLDSAYSFPSTGVTYAQSFLCITMDLENLNEVGMQLQYNEPQIYDWNILGTLNTTIPHLVDAAINVTVSEAPWYRQTNISSKNGVTFESFAKNRKFDKDLYADWLATSLKTDLYVETWSKGTGLLPSDCTHTYQVNNINGVNISVANFDFKNTNDHSKWAVSQNSDKTPWICIGDINRMERQKVRGGGTVCTYNKKLATNYQKTISAVEACSSYFDNDYIDVNLIN